MSYYAAAGLTPLFHVHLVGSLLHMKTWGSIPWMGVEWWVGVGIGSYEVGWFSIVILQDDV